MCVTITPRAARFVRMMIRMHAAPIGAGLRLQVRAGACSGLDSSFDVENEPLPGDTVLEQGEARLFLPEASRALLRGYTIDYGENRLDARLRFIRPNGTTACDIGACGAKKNVPVNFMRSAPSVARCG